MPFKSNYLPSITDLNPPISCIQVKEESIATYVTDLKELCEIVSTVTY